MLDALPLRQQRRLARAMRTIVEVLERTEMQNLMDQAREAGLKRSL